ncbi:MAG: BREX-1 system adenine-specific DNA-methyltransferase PglX, partial [Thermoleophilia bacterium]|nr:BREX-1 system adenine-specific DNA-methyltransferase PglX [Thermoleophilia bacterium]
METAPLKNFATWARTALIREVSARMSAVLAPGATERVEHAAAIKALESAISDAGGGDQGGALVIDKVAYTWFNRIIALRFMDANRYTGVGVVSPQAGGSAGQPEVLANAKRGVIDSAVVSSAESRSNIASLLDGSRASVDPQGEAYALLLEAYCNHWHKVMPFMFEREGDFTELLIPANLLADDSVLNRAVDVLTEKVCQDVEVIGWLYQFYISERKDEVFAGFKKNKKAGAAEIPAATQLFTPHWIVRYLIENSVGRLWMLNHPESRLVERMEYYIAPEDDEADYLEISSPEELTVIDPACGSGHMLTYAFDLLYSIYEEAGYSPADIPALILEKNLFGTEIDPRAGALAAFALTMKARARQRTFFNAQVALNLCVIEAIAFGREELDFLVRTIDVLGSDDDFWNQFANADTLGALVMPNAAATERIAHAINGVADADDLHSMATLELARRVVAQARTLSTEYVIAVANPPYMGSKNFSAELAEFAGSELPRSKADLFSMFIERSLLLIPHGGMAAMVTMQSWMFLPSYRELREALADQASILNLAHLDNMVMGIAFGTSATVWKKGDTSATGRYLFVDRRDITQDVPVRFPPANERNQIAGEDLCFSLAADQLAAIPGRPVAYWASQKVREVFGRAVRLDSIAEPRQGMATSDNGRFLRYAFEVSASDIRFGCRTRNEALESGGKWYPYSKGGERRKWYGNHELIVNWEDDGRELVAFAAQRYGSASRTIKNTAYYFREALTWSLTSSSGFAARFRPAGFIFDVNGMSSFAESGLLELLGTVNSRVGDALLGVINPTMALQAGDLKAFPYIPPANESTFVEAVGRCIEIARCDWDSQESSWEFERDPLVKRAEVASSRVADVVAEFTADWRELVEQLRGLEENINESVIDAYELTGELDATVSVVDLNLINNRRYRGGGSDDESERLVKNLISYSVGCMFGRYSLDAPGLILADQGATLQDYVAKVPEPSFTPDADGVIPIVDGDWFEDDIVDRFRQFLRVAFGEEHFEDNLQFVIDSLGVKSLRNYFVKSFYKDHVQRYKKRPI